MCRINWVLRCEVCGDYYEGCRHEGVHTGEITPHECNYFDIKEPEGD